MAFRGIERPSAQDDEDELLRLNAAFASQPPRRPAATSLHAPLLAKPEKASLIDVPKIPALAARGPGVRFEDDATAPTPARKRSLFAERRAQRQRAVGAEEKSDGTPKQRLQRDIESADQDLNQVLSDIVEKNISANTLPIVPCGGTSLSGFPGVVHRSERKNPDIANSHDAGLAPAGDTLSARGEHDVGENSSIHEENLRALQGMSATEIKEARAEIMAKLDPSLVAMLERRAAEKYGGSNSKSRVLEAGSLPASKEQSHIPEAEMTALPSDLSRAIAEQSAVERRALAPKKSGGPPLPDASWIPTFELEYEKLEWTTDLPPDDGEVSPSTDASELRFGFSGEVIEKTENIAHHRALHHHGDEPTKAGYSVDEILSLSRSTVPSQRAIALRVLSAIIQNVYNGAYSRSVSRPLLWLLIRKNHLMHLRIAMDDSHETVIGTSLAAVAASLGCGSLIDEGEERCWDDLSYARQGHRAFAISVQAQEHFRFRATGIGIASEPYENEDSIEAIALLMRRDGVAGLLSTNLLTRFAWLLQNRKLPFVPVGDILSILIRVCRHSRSAAEQIAECAGLVQVIHTRFISLPWTVLTPDDCFLRLTALKLVRLLCQSGSDIAASLVKFGIVHDLLRYAIVDPETLPPSSRDLGWRLQSETWSAITVLFAYRLSASLFDEYRGPLLESAQRLLRPPCRKSSEWPVLAKISFLRMLTMLLRSFGDMLDVGGADDALQPFVELALEHGAAQGPFILRSAEWDFLAAYAVCLTNTHKAKGCSYLARVQAMLVLQGLAKLPSPHLFGTNTLLTMASATSRAAAAATSSLGQHFVGLHDASRVEAACALVRLNEHCESLASLIDMLGGIRGVSPEWDSFAQVCLTRVRMNQRIFDLIEQTTEVIRAGDWIQCFFPAKGALLYSWIVAGNFLDDAQSTYVSNCAVALAALPSLLPGDEFMAGRLLNRYVLHPQVQAALVKSAGPPSNSSAESDGREDFAAERLQELLDHDMYSDSALQQSEALHGRRAYQATSLLMDGGATKGAALPVRGDWMYSPFQRLLADSEKFGHLIAHARRAGELQQGRGDELIVECLRLINRVERAVEPFAWCRWQLAEAIRVARLMCVFLVPSSTPGNEIFAREEVGTLLDALLRRCTVNSRDTWDRCNLEQACGGRSRFYQFYHSLIEHFAATSFGDPVFARYLLLPLSMRYPVDFRELFWSELNELLPSFGFDPKTVVAARSLRDYFLPLETNQNVLLLYIRSLADGKVAATRTPFLYLVATHHVHGFLCGEGQTAGSTQFYNQAARLLGSEKLEVLKAWAGVAPDGTPL
ncbi:RNA polymerase II associated protein 1 [Geranomyces variabilis]|uniref:RNA polymerase II associated protein 1 n=1 Tax=Geranomyces variabilis TaxID=109894 RepID=A0AAD5TIF9_9FUNG|nr:RNA polymerase II associated protein 1 [Geranomyces variabilis]